MSQVGPLLDFLAAASREVSVASLKGCDFGSLLNSLFGCYCSENEASNWILQLTEYLYVEQTHDHNVESVILLSAALLERSKDKFLLRKRLEHIMYKLIHLHTKSKFSSPRQIFSMLLSLTTTPYILSVCVKALAKAEDSKAGITPIKDVLDMLDEDNTIPLATQVILIMDIAECSAGCASTLSLRDALVKRLAVEDFMDSTGYLEWAERATRVLAIMPRVQDDYYAWMYIFLLIIDKLIRSQYSAQVLQLILQKLRVHTSWHDTLVDKILEKAKESTLTAGEAAILGALLEIHEMSTWIEGIVYNAAVSCMKSKDFAHGMAVWINADRSVSNCVMKIAMKWLNTGDLYTLGALILAEIVTLNPSAFPTVLENVFVMLARDRDNVIKPDLLKQIIDAIQSTPLSLDFQKLIVKRIQSIIFAPLVLDGIARHVIVPLVGLLSHEEAIADFIQLTHSAFGEGIDGTKGPLPMAFQCAVEIIEQNKAVYSQLDPHLVHSLEEMVKAIINNANEQFSLSLLESTLWLDSPPSILAELLLTRFLTVLVRDLPMSAQQVSQLPAAIRSIRLKNAADQRVVEDSCMDIERAASMNPRALVSLLKFALGYHRSDNHNIDIQLLTIFRSAVAACATGLFGSLFAKVCVVYACDILHNPSNGFLACLQTGSQNTPTFIALAVLNVASPYLGDTSQLSTHMSIDVVINLLRYIDQTESKDLDLCSGTTLMHLLAVASHLAKLKSISLQNKHALAGAVLRVLISAFNINSQKERHLFQVPVLNGQRRSSSGESLVKSTLLAVLHDLLTSGAIPFASDEDAAVLRKVLPSVFYFQHEETMRSTINYQHREDSVEARKKHTLLALQRRKGNFNDDDDIADSFEIVNPTATRRPLHTSRASIAKPAGRTIPGAKQIATATDNSGSGQSLGREIRLGTDPHDMALRTTMLICKHLQHVLKNGIPLHLLIRHLQVMNDLCAPIANPLGTKLEGSKLGVLTSLGEQVLLALTEYSISDVFAVKLAIDLTVALWRPSKCDSALIAAVCTRFFPSFEKNYGELPHSSHKLFNISKKFADNLRDGQSQRQVIRSVLDILNSRVYSTGVNGEFEELEFIVRTLNAVLLPGYQEKYARVLTSTLNKACISLRRAMDAIMNSLRIVTTKKATISTKQEGKMSMPLFPSRLLVLVIKLGSAAQAFAASPRLPTRTLSKIEKSVHKMLSKAAKMARMVLKNCSPEEKEELQKTLVREGLSITKGRQQKKKKKEKPHTIEDIEEVDDEKESSSSAEDDASDIVDEEGSEEELDLGGSSEDEADAIRDRSKRPGRKRRLRSTNAFIDAVLRVEGGDDDFADLEDFIVAKKGKQYFV